jgi:pimeloyl-ACP methyl ester carboxylesterase
VESIDQGGKEIAIEETTFVDGTLSMKMPNMKSAYTGKMEADGNTIKGEMEQVGAGKMPLDLKRQAKAVTLNRPQHPKKPYPYVEEELTFESKAKDVKLAGTLTKPKGDGPFPAVILISGSGPQDRDETLMGHKPFLVIADYLTRRGIAVLRYDDRGIGKSTGRFADATSKDFADDAAGAVAFLKPRKDIGKIGLMGHSEGGLIAPMVAAENPDIGFIVLLAGPGEPGDVILIAQGQLIVKAMGGDEKALARQKSVQTKLIGMVKEGADEAMLKAALKDIEKELTDEEKKELDKVRGAAEGQIARLGTPWFRFFLTYDPRPTLGKVKCPVLAVNGDLDLQVPAKENLEAIEKAVRAGGNTDVTVRQFPALNHLFQTSKMGLPTEYGKIEETFAPAVLETIGEWITKRK